MGASGQRRSEANALAAQEDGGAESPSWQRSGADHHPKAKRVLDEATYFRVLRELA
jgi:hypothetical protein